VAFADSHRAILPSDVSSDDVNVRRNPKPGDRGDLVRLRDLSIALQLTQLLVSRDTGHVKITEVGREPCDAALTLHQLRDVAARY